MTLQEFKLWFDGVIFAIGDRPTKDQWASIVERLASVKPEKKEDGIALPFPNAGS